MLKNKIKKFRICKEQIEIAEITIGSICVKGDKKIDALIKDLTFGEIQEVGDLSKLTAVSSDNYTLCLVGKGIMGYTFKLSKLETVIHNELG
jgi:hypothetical protein